MNTLTQTMPNPASRPDTPSTRPEPALLPPVDVLEDSTGITLYADLPGASLGRAEVEQITFAGRRGRLSAGGALRYSPPP